MSARIQQSINAATPGCVSLACAGDLIVANQVISTTSVFETCGTITVGPGLDVVSPGDVTLSAEGGVMFTDGVTIQQGAVLRVISGQ